LVDCKTNVIVAKGKGKMNTFWLLPKENASDADYNELKGFTAKSKSSSEKNGPSKVLETTSIPSKTQASPKIFRLVDWNVDVLKRLLKLIVAKRMAQQHMGISTRNGMNVYFKKCTQPSRQVEPGKFPQRAGTRGIGIL
jgi:hypothetical protein